MKKRNYSWVNDKSKKFLSEKGGYLLKGETVESRFQLIGDRLEELLGIEGYSDEFLGFLDEGFYALSTPFISNVGRKNALPFSCSNQHVPDSLGGIAFAKGETAMLTKMGMGCSAYMGQLRAAGEAIKDSLIPSPGSVYFAKSFNEIMKEINQGVRRGYIAMYWDAEHDDIMEALEIQRDSNDIQDSNYGVCISDEFLDKAKNDEYSVVRERDFNGYFTGNLVKARTILKKIHESRFMTGQPYIFFSDNVNNAAPDVYKAKDFTIKSSNLCTEILEVSNEDYSFVCDIAAMVASKINDERFPRAVQVLTMALDALHTEFQQMLEAWRDSENKEDRLKFLFLSKAYLSSKHFRDIGVGCTGYHTHLQESDIPFESWEAKQENARIFSTIQANTLKASMWLAGKYGEPEMLDGYGRRNCLLNAVAPNTSSSFIKSQCSQGIEPIFSNRYLKDVAKAKVGVKNPTLKALLVSLDQDNKRVWDSITNNDGSVQHLDFLSDHQKNVFKTFQEINPMEILTQAAQRQQYIDQGQSLNLMLNSNYGYKEANAILYKARDLGIKTLYYQHGTNAAQQARKNLLECDTCAG